MKKRNEQGFTLPEMLLAMLIVSIVTVLASGGLYVVRQSYEKITARAEAESLLSTAITAVSEEYRYAKNIEQAADGNWHFYNVDRGYRMYLDNKEKQIYLCTESSASIPLLTEKTSTSGLKVSIKNISYEESTHCFSFLIVVKNSKNVEQVKQEMKIEAVNAG